jgi:hypothetical protein
MSWLSQFINSLDKQARREFLSFYNYGGDDPASIGNSGTAENPAYNYNPSQNYYSGVNPNAYAGDTKEGASRLFADIIRAQTQDYLNRFAPIEDFLAGTITRTGTTFLEGDLERTREAVLGGGLAAQGQYSRNLERFGVMGKQLDNSMATASAMVGGLNDTRDRDQDRKIALLGGGLGSIAPKIRSSQGAT